MKNLKVVFMGTPEFAVGVLDALIKETDVRLVVSQPDKMVGRKKELKPTPVKLKALENNIEVFQPNKIREDYQRIVQINPDIIITCAYGQIIPKALLDLPKLGCINVHASLLPKLRGGAPIHKCLIDGYSKTGITIMYMDEKMDSGDIISQEEYVIKEDDNVGKLHDILSNIGAELLIKTLPSIINRTNKRIKQNEAEVTYAYNIKRDEEHLDFTKNCIDIYNQVRGLNPWPLANFLLDDKEIKVLNCHYKIKNVKERSKIIEITKDSFGIACNDGIIYLDEIKPFGKKAMTIKQYLNGVDKNALLNKDIK
jgi:methionyl-tRNA formyltransferase